MVKRLHRYLIIAVTVVMCLFLAGCKKEEVVYPPLWTETEVLERLKETYGEEFVIHNKTDLLSLGEVVKAPGPYSDIAEGMVYEASPVKDPSFLFKVYTYRTYGNASPIPFSKSGGVQAELEYHDCYGQDLLNRRFQKEAESFGIVYEVRYDGFRAYPMLGEKKYSLIDRQAYHTWFNYYIYINEEEVEKLAENLSACLVSLMQKYEYSEDTNFNTAIFIRINVTDKNGENGITSVGRVLFDKYGDEMFDSGEKKLIDDMMKAIQEKKK